MNIYGRWTIVLGSLGTVLPPARSSSEDQQIRSKLRSLHNRGDRRIGAHVALRTIRTRLHTDNNVLQGQDTIVLRDSEKTRREKP